MALMCGVVKIVSAWRYLGKQMPPLAVYLLSVVGLRDEPPKGLACGYMRLER
jgi:hypothetical protein